MPLELDDTAIPPAGAMDRTATLPSSPRPLDGGGGGEVTEGRRFGHFRVERPLGVGGMGEVYLATDLALDRPVALKVLPASLARDAKRRDWLIREARAQARIVHVNVGHIYFIGEEDGLLYVAMEYVVGETLAQKAAAAPMPIDDALAAVRGAALGLREAHRAGFLHRDVKPSNLMVDAHGVLKLLDFGLAAGGVDPLASDDPARAGGSVTQTSFAGTPLYMAPEQARGEAIDARADIYALGATLFHIVSGRPPFEAGSVAELRDLHASAPRPRVPATTQPRTAIALGELCARMMAPRPADRFPSYDELLAAIDVLETSRARPAGFSARSVAVLIDFTLFSTLLVLIALGMQVLTGYVFELFMPVLFASFGVYEAVCTRRWGATAGKAALDLEVVRADTGERPGWRHAIRRAVVLTGTLTLLGVIEGLIGLAGYRSWLIDVAEIVVFVGMFVALGHASARSHGKRAPWDRVAGTLVRYRSARPAR